VRAMHRRLVIAYLFVLAVLVIALGAGAGALAHGAGLLNPSSAGAATPVATSSPTPTGGPSPTPAPTASPTPAPTATPSPTPTPTPTGPFEIDLYRDGDFASQAKKTWCVGGALQTMLNVIGPDEAQDASLETQTRLMKLARRLSAAPDGGVEPQGWAAVLNREGVGPYRVEAWDTRKAALRRAVEALRATGRPVGLLVWRGAHSWVLTGFRTSLDPAATDDYTIERLRIADPWYPAVSSLWGPSKPPDAWYKPAYLDDHFLKWRRPTGPYPGQDGKYLLVVPVLDLDEPDPVVP
jgi:hypothetical protein